MPDRVLVTTDDLEYAVRVNAQLEAAGFATAMVTSFDDARDALGAREPDCLVVTGSLHEPSTARLLVAARDRAGVGPARQLPRDQRRFIGHDAAHDDLVTLCH